MLFTTLLKLSQITTGILIALVFLIQCNSASPPPLPATVSGPQLPIALLIPTGGELASMGRTVQNGFVLAFDEINETGGIAGRSISWQIYPTECTFDSGQLAAQQAMQDEHTFLLGPICTEAALGAATVVNEAALMIAPTAIHPRITVDAQGQVRPTVFTGSYGYPLQGQAVAHFAGTHLDVRQAAVLYSPTDAYASALAAPFIDQFQTDGGHVTELTYPPGTTDFSSLLSSAKDSEAELLYLPVDANTANQMVSQLSEIDRAHFHIVGSDAWATDELDRNIMEGSFFPVHYTQRDPHPSLQAWAEKYKSVYAVEPDTLAALAYDTAHILASAIEQADSLNPKDVAKAIEQNTFDGVTGPIAFGSQHTPIKPVPFLQIREQTLYNEATLSLP